MLGKYLCSKEQINYLIRHFEVKKNGIKRKNTITVTSIFIRSPKKNDLRKDLISCLFTTIFSILWG